jgi:hypothetical protein
MSAAAGHTGGRSCYRREHSKVVVSAVLQLDIFV